MSQNLDKQFRLVQNSHKLLSNSLDLGKENLESAAGIPFQQGYIHALPFAGSEGLLGKF